jgi:hypothetical protein
MQEKVEQQLTEAAQIYQEEASERTNLQHDTPDSPHPSNLQPQRQ